MSKNYKEPTTEESIINAAEEVFLTNGVNRTTMSMIAIKAKISRTSLNYYYRSKEQLFNIVFSRIIGSKIIPSLTNLIESEITILEKIKNFIDEYIDLGISNPSNPVFLIMELQREPGPIVEIFGQMNLNIKKLKNQIDHEIKTGLIKQFNLEDLYTNVMGMSIFPLLSKPVLMEHIFNKKDDEFLDFFENRKKIIYMVIEKWLKA